MSTPLRWVLLSRRVRAYVVIEHDARVLLVRNWLGKGEWSFPGGGSRANESALQAVLRETEEEIGVTLEPARVRFLREGFRKDGIGGKHYALFHAVLEDKPQIRRAPAEITDAEWVPITSVHELPLCYEALRAFEALR